MRMRKGKGRVKGWILLQGGESEHLVRVGVSWKMAKSRATSDLMATASGVGQRSTLAWLPACLPTIQMPAAPASHYHNLGPPPLFRILVRSPRLWSFFVSLLSRLQRHWRYSQVHAHNVFLYHHKWWDRSRSRRSSIAWRLLTKNFPPASYLPLCIPPHFAPFTLDPCA